MGLFSTSKAGKRGKAGTRAASRRVVATGKRVKGTWIMESLLSPKATSVRGGETILAGENRRIRTLH